MVHVEKQTGEEATMKAKHTFGLKRPRAAPGPHRAPSMAAIRERIVAENRGLFERLKAYDERGERRATDVKH